MAIYKISMNGAVLSLIKKCYVYIDDLRSCKKIISLYKCYRKVLSFVTNENNRTERFTRYKWAPLAICKPANIIRCEMQQIVNRHTRNYCIRNAYEFERSFVTFASSANKFINFEPRSSFDTKIANFKMHTLQTFKRAHLLWVVLVQQIRKLHTASCEITCSSQMRRLICYRNSENGRFICRRWLSTK